MRLYALSDLHLAHAVDKPMDIFGARWDNHVEKIIHHWTVDVGADDTVLIGGDISWANSLEEALPDLSLIDCLPGKKILLRGNHDYWWTTLRKMEMFCEEKGLSTLQFLRNDAIPQAGFDICGTRGWLLPTDEAFDAAAEKVFNREKIRLDLSLQGLEKLRKKWTTSRQTVALMHYPPISEKGTPSALSEQLEKSQVDVCLFGHIHHHAPYYSSSPFVVSVRYIMTASDQLKFRPLLIGDDGQLCIADVEPSGGMIS